MTRKQYTYKFTEKNKMKVRVQVKKITGINLDFWETAHLPLP